MVAEQMFSFPLSAKRLMIADIGGARLWHDSVGITLTMIAVLGLLAVLQRRTKVGLAFRAVITSNRTGSTLVGIR